MYLFTILAYALLFWYADQPAKWPVVGAGSVLATLLIAVGPALVTPLIGAWTARRALRMYRTTPEAPFLAQLFHHRAVLILRVVLLAALGISLFCTPWPEWFAWERVHPALQLPGDLVVLAPFFTGVTLLWLAAHPVEQAFRAEVLASRSADAPDGQPWPIRSYLAFFLRNQLLVFAVPLTLILFAGNLTRGYGGQLRRWSNWTWTPDALLGAAAFVVFLIAPVLLRHIWSTESLPNGPLRQRLEGLCRRIGLRCRDILVWHSDGMLINAAVMGLVAPLRYVLLSDGLLRTMDDRQIEAVFGHEAGHVRHRHIHYFLLFAVVGWLVAAGIMELLLRLFVPPQQATQSGIMAVQTVSVFGTVAFWGLAFGWVSRRFERQADLYGAACVTSDLEACTRACAVHLEAAPRPAPVNLDTPRPRLPENLQGPQTPAPADRLTPQSSASVELDGRVCATAAAVFASALDRVARLNGIPHEERSWRHSSIGSRIRFLSILAGDPSQVARFNRTVRGIKAALLLVSVVGTAVAGYVYVFGVSILEQYGPIAAR